jgi:voltage-gated potassium channel
MRDEVGKGRGAAIGIGLIVGMVLLIVLAVGAHRTGLIVLLLVSVAVAVVSVRAAVPGEPLLWITFGVCMPLYSAAYATTLTTLFQRATPFAVYAGYLLPLAVFITTLSFRRAAVSARLATLRPGSRPRLAGGLIWLVLSAACGLVARALLPADAGAEPQSQALLGMMALIAALALAFVLDVATLLVETGTLFRTFATRMARRVVPIISFVVVFLFVVVVFASLYAVLDRFSGVANFSVGGASRAMVFAEAMYFSFVTLSTIGYGDITPVTHVARVMVVGEIIFGVVLMLFAFAEIAAYDPEAQNRSDADAAKPPANPPA